MPQTCTSIAVRGQPREIAAGQVAATAALVSTAEREGPADRREDRPKRAAQGGSFCYGAHGATSRQEVSSR